MASTFLLPLGVVIYTLTGGIKATYELAISIDKFTTLIEPQIFDGLYTHVHHSDFMLLFDPQSVD